MTQRRRLTPGGWSFSETSTGHGITYQDFFGNVLWRRDPDGTQMIMVPASHRSRRHSEAILRQDPAGRTWTVAIVSDLDPSGMPITRAEYGDRNERHWSWSRDGSGEVLEERSPDGRVTRFEGRNLLGWPRRIAQMRSSGSRPEFDRTELAYSHHGQVSRITDPAGQVTELRYNAHGDLVWKRLPGNPPAIWSMSYDEFGRPTFQTLGGVDVRNVYDVQGDLKSLDVLDSGTWRTAIEYQFDDLERLVEVVDVNHGLAGFLAKADRTVVAFRKYDVLGRIEADGVKVGRGPIREVRHTWSVVPPDVWRRVTSSRMHHRRTGCPRSPRPGPWSRVSRPK